MRSFGWFSLLVTFWILVELSFLRVMFPDLRAPVVIIALAIACIAVPDWRAGYGWAVASALSYDILRAGMVTPFVVYVAILAYSVGFLARRIAFRPEAQHWLFVPAVIGAVTLYEILDPLLSWPRWPDLLIALPVWLLVSASVRTLHAWLALTSFSEFRGMRHS